MIDADNVNELLKFEGAEWFEAQKKALTRVAGPFCLGELGQQTEILTTDGLVLVEPGSYYIALDVYGNPYPIEEGVFESAYERAA